MKRLTRFLSFILIAVMAMQVSAVSAFAQSLEAHWGQDFPDEDYGFSLGEAVFWQRADITNFEFQLYKDNAKVFTCRIEEGVWGDETEGDWYNESLFLPKFYEYGTGSYHFTVSSLSNNQNHIDDETVIDTATSGTFYYTKPTGAVSVPRIVSNQDGVIDWEKTDSDTFAYVYDLEVDYGNGVIYDPDYTETYCWDEDQSEYDVEAHILSALEYIDANYNGKYPIEKAQVKIRVRAMPEDITALNPSDYTDWYTIDYQYAGGNEDTTEPEDTLDRTVIAEKYYNAAKVVYDIGLMDDIYKTYQNTVTRGDMAELATKMLGMEDLAAANKDKTYFTDIEAGTMLNGYACTMYQRGLMPMISSGVFGAENEMTCKEIVKILVAMAGYEPLAQSQGGYPTGYFYVASSAGMLSGVSISMDATVTMEQMAKLVYNTIHVGIMQQTGWGTSAMYEITKDTLLYNYMGISRFIGNVTFADEETVSLSGFLYSSDYTDGTKHSASEVAVLDKDILTYEKEAMELYVDGNEILSGLEYTGVVIIANNGETETTARVIPVEIYSYGGIYTMYKIGSTGTYKPIPEGEIPCLLSDKHGKQNITIYVANEDASVAKSQKISITHENLRKATFMVNGEVYATKEIGCGNSVSAPTVSMSGYTFNGWLDKPTTMPDADIVVHGTATPNVTYTGTVTMDGVPQFAYIYMGGAYVAAADTTTGNFSFVGPKGQGIIKIVSGSITRTYCVNSTYGATDLGTIDLSELEETVTNSDNTVVYAEFKKPALTDEDHAYKEIEGNAITVGLNVEVQNVYTQSTAIKNEIASKYPNCTGSRFYNITLTKQRTGTETSTTTVTETERLVTVTFARSTAEKGKTVYAVLREHEGSIDVLTTVPNEDGEYIEVTDTTITVYAKKFSQYAILLKDSVRYTGTLQWTTFESVTVKVTTLNNAVDTAVLYVAFYDKENKMVGIASKADFAASNQFDVPENVETIKVFIWDGVSPLMQTVATSIS